jgi:hypothetical protein
MENVVLAEMIFWFPLTLNITLVKTSCPLLLYISLCCLLAEPSKKAHQSGVGQNFWTTRVKAIKVYIFRILVSSAIDWYIYESNYGNTLGVLACLRLCCL